MRFLKQPFTLAFTLALVFGMSSAASAQDKKNETWSEENATTIEVKDGKVLVNGEVVAELEDADTPVLFKKGEGEGDRMWFSGSDGVFSGRGGRTLFFDGDSDNQFTVSARPRAFGFVSKDGDDVEWVSEYEHQSDMSGDYDVAFGKFEEMNELRRDMDSMRSGRGNNALYAPTPFGFRSGANAATMKQERQARELALKIRREDGDTSEMEAELSALLDEIFVAKQNTQQERVDKLREQLSRLEERLSQRGADKSEIIEKHKNELLGKSGKYEW